MATNTIFQPNYKNNRARVVPAGTKSGDHLLVDGRPAVALTDRGDGVRSATTLPKGIASLTYHSGGASLKDDQATVAFDGTFFLPVTGATTTTGNDVKVYITSTGDLTLTAGSNTLFGLTDYPESFNKTAGFAAVRIGVL